MRKSQRLDEESEEEKKHEAIESPSLTATAARKAPLTRSKAKAKAMAETDAMDLGKKVRIVSRLFVPFRIFESLHVLCSDDSVAGFIDQSEAYTRKEGGRGEGGEGERDEEEEEEEEAEEGTY